MVELTPGKACKCSCRVYKGNDGKNYWYNSRTDKVYSTDCHKSNPIEAKGTFKIGDKTIIQ